MKTMAFRSLRTGLTFGAVNVFLILIGFNAMIGTLLAKALGVQVLTSLPAVPYLAAFSALVGLWSGLSAARKCAGANLTCSVLAGFLSGMAAGAVTFLFCAGIGWLLVNKIDFRNYLTILSFDFISSVLMGLPPLAGALANLGVLAAAGAAGGLLHGAAHAPRAQNIGQQIQAFIHSISKKVQRFDHGKGHLALQIGSIAIAAAAIIFSPLTGGLMELRCRYRWTLRDPGFGVEPYRGPFRTTGVGLYRVFCHWCLHHGVVKFTRSAQPDVGILASARAGRAARRPGRTAAWAAAHAPARRLPGHRHPWFWGDHPHPAEK
jgi:hypothetical protein